MTDDFSERAAQVAEAAAGRTTAFLLVTSAQREPIDEAIWFRRTLAAERAAVRRRDRQPRPPRPARRHRAQATWRPRSRARLAAELAARVAENFLDYHVLARRDARNLGRLCTASSTISRCCSCPSSTTTSTTSRACCGSTATCSPRAPSASADRGGRRLASRPRTRPAAQPRSPRPVRRRSSSATTAAPAASGPRSTGRSPRNIARLPVVKQLPDRLLGDGHQLARAPLRVADGDQLDDRDATAAATGCRGLRGCRA